MKQSVYRYFIRILGNVPAVRCVVAEAVGLNVKGQDSVRPGLLLQLPLASGSDSSYWKLLRSDLCVFPEVLLLGPQNEHFHTRIPAGLRKMKGLSYCGIFRKTRVISGWWGLKPPPPPMKHVFSVMCIYGFRMKQFFFPSFLSFFFFK